MAKQPNTAQGAGRIHGHGHGRKKVRRGNTGRKPNPNNAPLNAPMTVGQANRLAAQDTRLKYGTAENQLATRASQVAPWFQQYQAQIGAQQQQTAAQNQPLINQAYTAAQNTATPTLQGQGVAPNSPASHDDQLAALGRQALATAAAGQLAAIQAGANQYFGAQQSVVAPMYQQSVATDIANQQSNLSQEKGAYQASTLGTIRDNAQKTALENAAFGLNVANTQADNQRADQQLRSTNRNARKSRQAAAKSKANTVNQYGYTAKDWASFTPAKRQQIMARVKAQGRAPGSGSGANAKPPTAAQQKTASQIRRGVVLVRQGDTTNAGYWQDAYGRLVRDDGLDPIVARAIVMGARRGKLGPGVRKALRDQFGITNIKIPGKPHRPKPNRTGGPVSDGTLGHPYGKGAGVTY